MRLVKIGVDWMDGYGNTPEWLLHFDAVGAPGEEDLRYEARPPLYLAVLGDYASFYSWSGQPSSGYGGRRFDLTMIDGTTTTLVGPWSSRAGAVNGYFPECRVVDGVWRTPEGHNLGVHALAHAVERCWREGIYSFGLAWVRAHNEWTLQPTRGGLPKNECQEFVEVS